MFPRFAIGLSTSVAVIVGCTIVDRRRCRVLAAVRDDVTPYKGWGTKWDHNWDKRGPENPKPDDTPISEGYGTKAEKTKTPVRHIILIRHGHSNLCGKTDKENNLTKLGREQAELVAKRLADIGVKYTLVLHSTMTRAQETARIISEKLSNVPLQVSNLLDEGAPVLPDPLPRVAEGVGIPEHDIYRDGARIEAAFRKFFYRADPESQSTDSYEIVVCHANVIRYFVCRALQFAPEAWLRMSIRHCSITWISLSHSGRVTLRDFSDTGFMPPESISVT